MSNVIAVPGLDPGIDPAIHLYAKKMDPQVKPASDGGLDLRHRNTFHSGNNMRVDPIASFSSFRRTN